MSLLSFLTNIFDQSRQQAMPENTMELAYAKVNAMHDAQAGEIGLTMAVQQMIERDEGDRLTAYPDPAPGGRALTIGFCYPRPELYPGLSISPNQTGQCPTAVVFQ